MGIRMADSRYDTIKTLREFKARIAHNCGRIISQEKNYILI